MKNYKVTVNGNVYDVTVEETTGAYYAPVAPVMQAQAPIQAPVMQAAPVQAQPQALASEAAPQEAAPATPTAPSVSGAQGSLKVTAPMPGKILNVIAQPGTSVKKGETIIILEAMKMENEIVAPQDGTVATINVATGASVESGSLLATLN